VARFLHEFEAWIRKEVNRMKDVPVPVPRVRGTRADYLARKEEARTRIMERLAYFAPRYGLTFGRVAIKNMTSRWGSCSAKRNLNFHYKAVDLPNELLDYLVVHELCHLKEMNHGPRFWALVAQEVPEYRTLRTRLRVEHV
jgi:predicted metal-dependent hydrolase